MFFPTFLRFLVLSLDSVCLFQGRMKEDLGVKGCSSFGGFSFKNWNVVRRWTTLWNVPFVLLKQLHNKVHWLWFVTLTNGFLEFPQIIFKNKVKFQFCCDTDQLFRILTCVLHKQSVKVWTVVESDWVFGCEMPCRVTEQPWCDQSCQTLFAGPG